jgi:hypothetical protein
MRRISSEVRTKYPCQLGHAAWVMLPALAPTLPNWCAIPEPFSATLGGQFNLAGCGATPYAECSSSAPLGLLRKLRFLRLCVMLLRRKE